MCFELLLLANNGDASTLAWQIFTLFQNPSTSAIRCQQHRRHKIRPRQHTPHWVVRNCMFE